MRQWQIYVLKDPTSQAVRYVGWTCRSLADRLSSHKSEALRKNTDGKWHRINHRLNWLRALYLEHQVPIIESVEAGPLILDGGTDDAKIYQEAEKKWIQHFKSLGADLVNGTEGGEGGPAGSICSEKRRALVKAKAQARALAMSAEERQALGERTRAIMADPQMRQRLSEQHKLRFVDPQKREEVSVRQRKYFEEHPEHAAAARGALHRGVTRMWSDPQMRAAAEERARELGKLRRGEANACAKLTEEAVRDIRKTAKAPYKGMIMALARKYKVDKKLIRLVIDREIWVDVVDINDSAPETALDSHCTAPPAPAATPTPSRGPDTVPSS